MQRHFGAKNVIVFILVRGFAKMLWCQQVKNTVAVLAFFDQRKRLSYLDEVTPLFLTELSAFSSALRMNPTNSLRAQTHQSTKIRK